ncbi:methyltransferase [Shewanella sp. Scap07]|uniref:spermidine synthase n=1 Tax=Shewanella sp. Scap07 TaxID=2589987 RepID=UPI0015BBE67B|nr:fused MFS/spermidine synthase [Shewanella sp. Scap07]QLE84279.1 methyltransferase [Shewanella sp. Scap07]
MSEFQVLYESSDALGPLIVLDSKTTRTLSFGDSDEQSKLLKLQPHIPQHTYLQAMLLVLLFQQPKRVMVLGLGGGGLIHALKHFDAGIKMTAVELRPQVIELAKRYFQLPMSKKLTIEQADAAEFLAAKQHKKVDIIFADIYSAEGVDDKQLSAAFIADASAMLKAEGVLVLNCWKEHSQDRALLARLQQHFAQVSACLTGGGNWVIFATKRDQQMTISGLKNKAQQLSQQLDFPLARLLTRFDVWS